MHAKWLSLTAGNEAAAKVEEVLDLNSQMAAGSVAVTTRRGAKQQLERDPSSAASPPRKVANTHDNTSDGVMLSPLENDIEEWSDADMQAWVRITTHRANQAAERELDKGSNREQCLAERSKIIHGRWNSAKSFIPESLHQGLLTILCEPPV